VGERLNRKAVLKKLKNEAKRQGKTFEVYELTNHQGVRVGGIRSTLKRHSEIDEVTAGKFWDQFQSELGKGWWR
jgi:hypothetical protein